MTRRCMRFVVLVGMLGLLGIGQDVRGEEQRFLAEGESENRIEYLAEEVHEVKDEEMMICQLIQSMQKRKKQITIWYPNMEEDMLRYRENGYKELFVKLAEEDGYVAAGVEQIWMEYDRRQDMKVSFRMQYRTTRKQEQYVDRKVSKITRRIRVHSAAAKAKWARDYLVCNVVYDKQYCSAYDAFSKGRGNCMAYSLAYLRLLQELEVPCIYVYSKDHAWNMVMVKGKWYSVDVTWDDAMGDYVYFLKGTKDFRDHGKIQFGLNRAYPLASRQYSSFRMFK